MLPVMQVLVFGGLVIALLSLAPFMGFKRSYGSKRLGELIDSMSKSMQETKKELASKHTKYEKIEKIIAAWTPNTQFKPEVHSS